jgi:nitrite reductase/ring-hydroxylating ferredoxin subunit
MMSEIPSSTSTPAAARAKPSSRRWDAGEAALVAERGRLVIDVGGTTVGIFRVDGKLYAYENVCPHQGGPVCQGLIIDAVREVLDEGKVSLGMAFDADEPHIVCPWHGYEFRIATGRHAAVDRIGLRTIPVEEIGGRVYVVV